MALDYSRRDLRPIAASRDGLKVFEVKRWCIEQVLAGRAKKSHADVQPLHVEADALFKFMMGPPEE